MNLMSGYGIDYIYSNGNVTVQERYPEWVRTEKLYNCENFSQFFGRRESLVARLFGIKGAARV